MMRMRRLAAFVTVALVAASCSLLEVGNDAATTFPPAASPSASSESTGTSGGTEPTTATTLSDCTAAPADIVLLCEAVALIQRTGGSILPDMATKGNNPLGGALDEDTVWLSGVAVLGGHQLGSGIEWNLRAAR